MRGMHPEARALLRRAVVFALTVALWVVLWGWVAGLVVAVLWGTLLVVAWTKTNRLEMVRLGFREGQRLLWTSPWSWVHGQGQVTRYAVYVRPALDAGSHVVRYEDGARSLAVVRAEDLSVPE